MTDVQYEVGQVVEQTFTHGIHGEYETPVVEKFRIVDVLDDLPLKTEGRRILYTRYGIYEVEPV